MNRSERQLVVLCGAWLIVGYLCVVAVCVTVEPTEPSMMPSPDEVLAEWERDEYPPDPLRPVGIALIRSTRETLGLNVAATIEASLGIEWDGVVDCWNETGYMPPLPSETVRINSKGAGC